MVEFNPVETIVSTQDFYDAEDFLVEFLSEQIPEASFERGSALRDLAVTSFVLMYAYLRGEAEGIRVRQSIESISDELDEDAVDVAQSLDQILSNWFVNRREGTRSRMTAQMHFTKKEAYSLPVGTAFWRDFSHAFYLDIEGDTFIISASSLLPSFDSYGNLIDYVAEVPLIAASTGTEYEFPPGRFSRVITNVGNIPNLSYVEHRVASSVADSDENSASLIARANTAIAVRNLINNRSVNITLTEEFPDVQSTLTIGMGESEMQRDLRTELGSHIRLHIGGHYDTFLESPDQSVEEFGLIGGYFPRPDNIINVFRDPKMTIDEAFPFTSIVGLQVGHILYIRDGIRNSPRGYQIIQIEDHELFISEAMPFTEASDEEGTDVEYSIGWFPPNYNQASLNGPVVRIAEVSTTAGYEHIPAGTSRHIQSPGAILLQGRPVLDMTLVEIIDPSGGSSIYVDPSRGTIVFPTRVNGAPEIPPVPVDLSALSYRVEMLNPTKGQSAESVTRITVGFDSDPTFFDDRTLHVTYLTAAGFSNVADYTKSYNDRVVAANHLARMRHPIWIEMLIPYRLKPTAADGAIEVDVSTTLSNYVNSFDPNDDLDQSDIATAFRNASPDVGTVFPFDIYYNLYAPDGQVAAFKTTDIVSIFITPDNGVELLNGADIVVPPSMVAQGVTEIETAEDLLEWYDTMGISDRTVKYRTRSDLINFIMQG
jgi:hypothetical protein